MPLLSSFLPFQALEFDQLFRTTIDADLERKVDAAEAHGKIVEAVEAARESADAALVAAEEASSMVRRKKRENVGSQC